MKLRNEISEQSPPSDSGKAAADGGPTGAHEGRREEVMNCNRMSALPYRLVFPLMAAMLFIVTGCATWQWTDIEWYNTSDETIYVSAVDGMLPLAHCGYLSPHPVRDSSYRASLSYGDPVTVDSLLTVVWLTDDGATTNSSTFNRDHFGIPPRISGGTVTFCLLKAGEWEIEYSKER